MHVYYYIYILYIYKLLYVYMYIYIYIELVTTLYAAGILSDNCSQFANWEATM